MSLSRRALSSLLAIACVGFLAMAVGSALSQDNPKKGGRHAQRQGADASQTTPVNTPTADTGFQTLVPGSGAGKGDPAAARADRAAARAAKKAAREAAHPNHAGATGTTGAAGTTAAAPTSLSYKQPIEFGNGIPVKGWVSLEVDSSGNWTYSGHFRDPGKTSYSEKVAIAIKAADGSIYVWSHTATETAGQGHDADWNVTGTYSPIMQQWTTRFNPSRLVCGYEAVAGPPGTAFAEPLPGVKALNTSGMGFHVMCK